MRPAVLVAGCLLAMTAGQLPAQGQIGGLGRLFSTEQQRRELDRIRQDPDWGKPPPEPPPPVVEEPVAEVDPEPDRPAVGQVSFDGVVIRSSGRDVAWINGESVGTGGVSAEGLRVRTRADGQRARIELPSGSETVELKPGQKIDVGTGTVVEAYERRGDSAAPSAFRALPVDGADPAGDAEAQVADAPAPAGG